jgi:hypothetical protein
MSPFSFVVEKSHQHKQIAEGEKGFCPTVKPIHIGEQLSIPLFGQDGGANGNGDKKKGELKTHQGETGEAPDPGGPVEESEIGHQGKHKQGPGIQSGQAGQGNTLLSGEWKEG